MSNDLVAFLNARTCSADGCDRGGKLTRGMCTKCYRYWLDHTPAAERPVAPRFTRDFWDFVQKTHEHGCWLWTGPADKKGYGRWGHEVASRHSWEWTNGPIPDGLWILHHCDNAPCVNPAHLYPGTIVENARDAVTRGRTSNQFLKKPRTHCSEGHEIVGENRRIVGATTRRRKAVICRICDNARSRALQAAKRAQRKAA